MEIYFLELPGWHFEAAVVSAGVYRLTGLLDGAVRVEATGTDTTELLERCRLEALAITPAAPPPDS